jgi:hypothetical protein
MPKPNSLFNDTFLLKFPHFNFPQDKSDKPSSRQDHSPVYGKDVHHPPGFNVGYLVSPYTYANGAAAGLPVSMVSFYNYSIEILLRQFISIAKYLSNSNSLSSTSSPLNFDKKTSPLCVNLTLTGHIKCDDYG